MTTVHTLASGSSGNAALVCCGDTRLLVDAGISCRRITASLRELGLALEDLTAILLTHTHAAIPHSGLFLFVLLRLGSLGLFGRDRLFQHRL